MKKRRLIQGISLAVPAAMYETLRRNAREKDVSMSEIIRDIIRQHFSSIHLKEDKSGGKGDE